MDADLLWRILSAVVANQGAVQLTEETAANPEVAAILGFLVEQGWLEEGHPVGMCVVTPIGRLWVDQVMHGHSLKFYEYGGKTFLLNWESRKTIVWHKGRFATISAEFAWSSEYFEVRLERETVTISGGHDMENALATACCLLADDLEMPQPEEPERLEKHMFNFLDGL